MVLSRNIKIILSVLSVFTLAAVSGGYYLSDLQNVSAFNPGVGEVLQYNGKGWVNGVYTQPSFQDNGFLYSKADTIASAGDVFTLDGNEVVVSADINPKVIARRNNAGAAYIQLENTSNHWWWYCNAANAGLEPAIADAAFFIRDLANVKLWSFETNTKSLVVEPTANLKLEGKETGLSSIVGLSADDKMGEITLSSDFTLSGDELSLSSQYEVITHTATIDFASIASSDYREVDVPLASVVDGDVINVATTDAIMSENVSVTAWGSGVDLITVRMRNYDMVNPYDPASATFKFTIIR